MSTHSKKLKLEYWTLPCHERFKFGTGDPVVCKTACSIPVLKRGACAIMRVSEVPGKFVLLRGKDSLKVLETRFDLKNNIGIFSDAVDFQGKVLRESRAGHSMVPLLPEMSWENFMIRLSHRKQLDLLFFSANVMSEAFSVLRLQGSRTIRDVMISSGERSCQRLHRTFRRLRQKRDTANEQEFQVKEEVVENVVMDAESFLDQKPHKCDVMDVEESLHQKPREVCISADTASIDLVWIENTKLNRVKNGTRCLIQVGVRDWKSMGTSPSMIHKGGL